MCAFLRACVVRKASCAYVSILALSRACACVSLQHIGRRKRARYSVDMDLCSDEESSETVLPTPATRPLPLMAYIPPPVVEEPNPSALNAVIANTPIKRERY